MATRRDDTVSPVGWLVRVCAWAVIGTVVLMVAVSVVVPRLAGATPFTVLTGSMEPGMPPGTLVVVRPVDIDDVRIGDVITYQLESGRPAVVTHRVVAVGTNLRGESFVETQGDANAVPDEKPVLAQQIRGERWYSVPHLGRVVNVVTQSQRRTALTVVVAVLLLYAATMFSGAARDRRTPRTHLKRSHD
jgi:signal peptidase